MSIFSVLTRIELPLAQALLLRRVGPARHGLQLRPFLTRRFGRDFRFDDRRRALTLGAACSGGAATAVICFADLELAIAFGPVEHLIDDFRASRPYRPSTPTRDSTTSDRAPRATAMRLPPAFDRQVADLGEVTAQHAQRIAAVHEQLLYGRNEMRHRCAAFAAACCDSSARSRPVPRAQVRVRQRRLEPPRPSPLYDRLLEIELQIGDSPRVDRRLVLDGARNMSRMTSTDLSKRSGDRPRHLHVIAAQLVEQRFAGMRERRYFGEVKRRATALDRMMPLTSTAAPRWRAPRDHTIPATLLARVKIVRDGLRDTGVGA